MLQVSICLLRIHIWTVYHLQWQITNCSECNKVGNVQVVSIVWKYNAHTVLIGMLLQLNSSSLKDARLTLTSHHSFLHLPAFYFHVWSICTQEPIPKCYGFFSPPAPHCFAYYTEFLHLKTGCWALRLTYSASENKFGFITLSVFSFFYYSAFSKLK